MALCDRKNRAATAVFLFFLLITLKNVCDEKMQMEIKKSY